MDVMKQRVKIFLGNFESCTRHNRIIIALRSRGIYYGIGIVWENKISWQYVVRRFRTNSCAKNFLNCAATFKLPGRISCAALPPLDKTQIFRFHFVNLGISSNHDKLLFCTKILT